MMYAVVLTEASYHKRLESSAPERITCCIFFLFLSFRRVLNVICSFLGNSPASEF